MAEKEFYKFNAETDLLDHRNNGSLVYGKGNNDKPLPIVLDWAIGNKTCEEAQKNLNTFACHHNFNSYCIDSDNGYGYRCSCNKGYEGNPYISPGCQGTVICK
ncbi:hypothetical protein MKW92_027912 [Papaver armeniacum]|nr:hypothetical protein MKW92_027912 [Papaver armeniacum]